MNLTKEDVRTLTAQLKALKLYRAADCIEYINNGGKTLLFTSFLECHYTIHIRLSNPDDACTDRILITCMERTQPFPGSVMITTKNTGNIINYIKSAFLDHIMRVTAMTLDINNN